MGAGNAATAELTGPPLSPPVRCSSPAAVVRGVQEPWVDPGRGTPLPVRELDPELWRSLNHNPIALLQHMPIDKLEERASKLVLHGRINYAYRRMHEYLAEQHTWGARNSGVLWARPVAYFSAEFGLHES